MISPVEAPPISMHSCHPPPSLSHKEATFTSELATEVAPLIRSLHHIHCSMRTQFPDLRLIEYDCGKMLFKSVFDLYVIDHFSTCPSTQRVFQHPIFQVIIGTFAAVFLCNPFVCR